MTAKCKFGKELLFTQGESNKWKDIKDEIIINLDDKWTYKEYKFSKYNKLTITTTKGIIIIVFSSNLESCKFDGQEKDQLYFKIKKKII